MPVSPARAAAFDILLRVERDAAYASELLHSPAFEQLSPKDHALATELVMGVLRWRSRLDAEIAQRSSQLLTKLDLEILIAIRLALYQFHWLDRIPARAALHESVELVKRARKRSAAAFVNAVLRKLAATSISPTPASELDSAKAIASDLAHPEWLVQRWADAYGLDIARQICVHNQSVAATAIRMRTAGVESNLNNEGITLSPGRILKSARYAETGDITKSVTFRARQIVIQDEASQLVAALVAVPLGTKGRILDCCAAPGGKTLAIADRNPDASITALELHSHRALLMRKLLRASQTSPRIQIIAADATALPISGLFDRILADVPCSGTGTLSRNPEIKWRLTPGDLIQLQTRQSAILASALSYLTPGGRLIYSTCSLEKEENEDVIEQALTKGNSIRLLDCRQELDRLHAAGELAWSDTSSLTRGPFLRTIPGVHPCDGFFAAIFQRS